MFEPDFLENGFFNDEFLKLKTNHNSKDNSNIINEDSNGLRFLVKSQNRTCFEDSDMISKTFNQKNKAKSGIIFRVVYPNCFNIFNPGSYEKYPRDLINLISENKENISFLKRNKIKKKRKFYPDNIRRNIKCGFLNSLKNILNKGLKRCNSKFLFDYLPQNFIANVTKNVNKQILNMTFKQLFSKDFNEIKDKVPKNSKERCRVNILVIESIEKNKDVREKSNYNNYTNMTYSEIYYEYLRSKEFEEDIIKLEKKESKEYIKQYINLAIHLIDYFSSD